MKKHSFIDNDGRLWVACSECKRGGKGDKSCACGARIKKFNNLGCFLGELIGEPSKE